MKPYSAAKTHRILAPESNTERGYATDIFQLGFMCYRLFLVCLEREQEERRKYIDSRECCYQKIYELHNAKVVIEGHPEILTKLYVVFFGMMA